MAKKEQLFIRGARSNNLKGVDLALPYEQLVVVTGVSGSGKSSLVMDTLYAEGQRRYVESLSSYARQFLMRMKKPEVEAIEGLCPAIAIEQRVGNKNARSTVGTLTELYDYLRLLFARVGRTHSPLSGREVKKHAVSDIVAEILAFPLKTRYLLLAPLVKPSVGEEEVWLGNLLQKGYTRLQIAGELQKLEDLKAEDFNSLGPIFLLIDRLIAGGEADLEAEKRLADSVQTALAEGKGVCVVDLGGGGQRYYSTAFEADGIIFEEPHPQLFNFNSSLGACPVCEGYGKTLGIEEEKVIPDPNKSIYGEAVACWRGEKLGQWREYLLKVAHHFDFPVHQPYKALSAEQKRVLWEGNERFEGIYAFFKQLEEGAYKIQNRVLLARYRGQTTCLACKGKRLKPEALYVQVAGENIGDLLNWPVDALKAWLETLPTKLREHEWEIAKRLYLELNTRLDFMLRLGLSYLSLNRLSASLSGGEIQRIHLTRTLGSNLTGSLYLLDEPSIGLHARDTNRLVGVLRDLRDLGNTVVVVEHEEGIIRQADYLVDVGPEAGLYGGEIIYSGPSEGIERLAPHSLTAQYLSGERGISWPETYRKGRHFIYLDGACHHNLKSVSVQIPLQCLTVLAGVSGSGKTTLIRDVFYPALAQILEQEIKTEGSLALRYEKLHGDYQFLDKIEWINQQPIGKSSRSNPITYVGAYDAIRKLFSEQQAAKIQGFKPKHFSFNVEGGRCETCKGEGEIIVSMQFLADVRLLCEDCQGQRFKPEVLQVRYKGLSIYEVLNLSVDEALSFFEEHRDIKTRLQPLQDVGLGYIRLGQASSTLSGGEAQRVKLASFLNTEYDRQHILFIFDEPTTGLHFHDVARLMQAFQALIARGHTVVVIEHNLDVIKCADHLIELGPEGGQAGGYCLFQGPAKELFSVPNSPTAPFLREKYELETKDN